MSFPRARIQRFNEGKTDAPSPTRYDPKTGDKAKGGAFNKGERERTVSISSDTPSTSGTPFRTPFSMVKKHSCVPSSEKPVVARGMNFGEAGVTPIQQPKGVQQCEDYNDEAVLRAEIADKDHALAEYQALVDQLTLQVQECKEQEAAGSERYREVCEQLNAQIQLLQAKEEQISSLTSCNHETSTKLNNVLEEIKRLSSENEEKIVQLQEVTAKFNNERKRNKKLRADNEEQDKQLQDIAAKFEEECKKNKEQCIELEEITARFKDEQKKFEELVAKNEEKDKQLQEIMAMFMDEEKKNEEVKAQNEEKDKQLQEIMAKFMDEQKKIEEINAQNEEKDKQLQEIMAKFIDEQKKIEEINAQNEEKDKQLQEIMAKYMDEQKKNEEANAQNNEKDKQLQEILAKFMDEQKKIEEINAQNEEKDKQLQEILAKFMDEQKKIEEINAQNEEKDKQLQEILAKFMDEQKKIEEINAQNEEKDKQLQEIIAKLMDEQKKNEEVNAQNEEKDKQLQEIMAKFVDEQNKNEKVSAENKEKDLKLQEITAKFKDEWKKNEKLSEQLGELDSKVATFAEELKMKQSERESIAAELKKSKEECNVLKLKNLDLQLTVATQQDVVNNLNSELESCKAEFKAQLVELAGELTVVKKQCRKFEIAMAETRRSLEALGKRLLESENEVERLNQENETARAKLATAENDRNNADNNYRLLMDVKIDVEQRLTSAEKTEEVLRLKVKELELRNCELELSKNELEILKDTLEEDRKSYEDSLINLRQVVNEQSLQLVQLERMSLEQVEAVSHALISKLEEFERFSTEKIQKLNSEIHRIGKEKEKLSVKYTAKCEEFENLFTDHDILKTTFDITTKESERLKKHYEEQRIELDSVILRLSQIETEKASLGQQLETVEMAAQNFAKEVEDLKDTNKDQEAQIIKIEAEKASLAEQLETLEVASKNLTKEMEEIRDANKDQEAQIIKIEAEKASLGEQLETLEVASKNLTKEMEEIRDTNKDQEAQILKIESEKASLAEQLETLEVASKNLTKEVEELRDAKKDQEALIAHLQAEITSKTTYLESVSTELSQVRREMKEKLDLSEETKEKEVGELQKQIKDYQDKVLRSTDEVVALLLELENERKTVEEMKVGHKQLCAEMEGRERKMLEIEESLGREKEEACKLLTEALEELQKEKEELSSELFLVNEKKEYYKGHCMRLEERLAAADRDRDVAVKDFDEIHNILKSREDEVSGLRKRISELESLIGPFRQQLELYEAERFILENDREQLKRQHLEQAAKLGHQNHKQKIQHVVKLKQDIFQLRTENQKLQTELKTKNKEIENLREKVGEHPKRIFLKGKRPTSTPFKGKENDERMSPTPNVKQEPMSPGNPLKDRNF